MFERFRFTKEPFSKEIPVDQRLKLGVIEDEIQALKSTVESRLIGGLVAPAGTGKSVVLRTLQALLPEARYRTSYLMVNNVSGRALYREVARVTGAETAATFPSLVHKIQLRFKQTVDLDGLRPVLLFDEAHDMRPEVVSMIRLLTNFSMDSKLVVSVVLAGQLSLRETLMRPGLEDIRQRLSHFGELRLLSRDESKAYIDHRVKIAGAPKVPFDEGAIEALYEMSRGNMRAIDQLARKSLIKADGERLDVANTNHVMAARAELCL